MAQPRSKRSSLGTLQAISVALAFTWEFVSRPHVTKQEDDLEVCSRLISVIIIAGLRSNLIPGIASREVLPLGRAAPTWRPSPFFFLTLDLIPMRFFKEPTVSTTGH